MRFLLALIKAATEDTIAVFMEPTSKDVTDFKFIFLIGER